MSVVFLVLAFLIPVNSENMQASYEIMDKEGWYPVMPVLSNSLDTYFHSFLPGVLDDSTDAVMLHTALETDEPTPLRAAMDMQGYSYYWHGYVAVLRPLLSVFDQDELLYSESIALVELEGRTYKTIPVHWKLDAGKTYEMQTTVRDTAGKTYVLITENGEMPLNEYGQPKLDGSTGCCII